LAHHLLPLTACNHLLLLSLRKTRTRMLALLARPISTPPHQEPAFDTNTPFPISDYNYKEVQTAFRAARTHWPNADVRVVLLNTGFAIWKLFLDITEVEVDRVADMNVKAAFAFVHKAITAFCGQAIVDEKRGT
jgi:NAD(P)-dependent dehydrogenase (short-subunit alcohol dehydrogenase family)